MFRIARVGYTRRTMPNKNTSRRSWISWLNTAGFILLAGLLLSQMVQLYRFSERIEFIDELESMTIQSVENVEVAKRYLMQFGGDLNDIREFLLLPTTDYDFGGMQAVQSDAAAEDELSVEVFSLIEQLAMYEANQELFQANLEKVQAYMEAQFWTDNELRLIETGTGDFTVEAVKHPNKKMFSVEMNVDGSFSLEDFRGHSIKLEDSQSFDSLQSVLETEVTAALPAYIKGMESLTAMRLHWEEIFFPSAEFQALLTEREFTLSSPIVDDKGVRYRLENADGRWLVDFILDTQEFLPQIFMNIDVNSGNPVLELNETDQIWSSLEFALGEVDTRTKLQVQIDEFRQEMNQMLQDDGFKATLNKTGYKMVGPEEDETHINYLLKDGEEVLRVIFIDKRSGEIFVGTPGEEGVETLSQANSNLELVLTGKKKRWTCLV